MAWGLLVQKSANRLDAAEIGAIKIINFNLDLEILLKKRNQLDGSQRIDQTRFEDIDGLVETVRAREPEEVLRDEAITGCHVHDHQNIHVNLRVSILRPGWPRAHSDHIKPLAAARFPLKVSYEY
jgi:hypothetical protein